MPRRARLRLLPIVLAAVLAAAACGDDDALTTTAAPSTTEGTGSTSQAPTTGAPSPTAPTTTGATTTTMCCSTTSTSVAPAPFPGDTATKAGDGDGSLLTDVRVGNHEGYVRIVFDFQEPSFPSWEFGYVPGEIHGMIDPPGGWVEGDAFLIARFQPSGTTDISGMDPVPIYTGERRIDVGLGSVVQLLVIEDFEANLWWAIGLTAEKPFRVGTLLGPPRIYVDIAD